ncbi:MAG TPA: response regulator, partial [Planctomycetota bacterium]|nr:response regulator [Planctomycetota bacterium]
LHGGSVSVRSAGPGQGSEFTVRLPGAQAGAPRDRSSRRMIAPFDVARRILVVDDNFAAARLLRLLLLRLGDHEVRVAHDGTAALTEARAFGPEVIFLDIGLPGMDGYEVARRLREDPEFSRVLLVALTGYGQAEDRLRSFEAGFDEHLVKPPDIGAIRRVLGRSSRRGGSDARGGDRRAKDREE